MSRAALAAAERPQEQQGQDAVFQQSASLGTQHVLAAAQGALACSPFQ
ncbi:MAG TPA: hypothetical protein VGT24_03595 [Candidatus Acidoferrales bacterium]|nr:hypothetical protein [Candidatus Acidoferrales bacterium]